jgi:hypothetical protein
MIDSNKARSWSVPDAERAIRQAFMLKADDEGNLSSLRFKDIRDTITVNVGPINETTFNRARNALVERGELSIDPRGKERWYSWNVKADRNLIVAIVKESDLARIRQGSEVGTTGRPDEGWSFYGVPLSLRNRLHSRLRREVEKFQETIDAVVEEECEAFVETAARKAKGRLSASDIKKGKDALAEVLAEASDRSEEALGGEFRTAFLEKIAPGTGALALRKIMPESWSDERIRGKFLSKAYDITEEEAIAAISKAKQTFDALDKLLTCLHGKDRRWFVERFVALQHLGVHLVAVVR